MKRFILVALCYVGAQTAAALLGTKFSPAQWQFWVTGAGAAFLAVVTKLSPGTVDAQNSRDGK